MNENDEKDKPNAYGFIDRFRNAVLGATMADLPAMMTASGWRLNEKGDYVLDQQKNPHVKLLRDNLAAEGAGVILGEFGFPAIQGLYNLGVRGLAKSSNNWVRTKVINTKLKDINKSNAKIITDKEWDDAYNQALASNDMEEVQRLRDLHFYSKSNTVVKDKNDMPIETYHTVANRYDPNFTKFNPTIEGTHSAIYTTDDPFMSGSYTKQIVSKEESDLLIQDKINELKNYFSKLISKSKNKDQQIEAFTLYLKYMGTDKIAKQNVINDYPKLIDIHPERMKKLYINLEKPLIMDAKGDSWGHISTAKLPENVWENITNPPSFLSTRDIENLYKHFGYDGAVIKNVVDYGGNKISSRYLTPANVYEVDNPKNLKLSDAITYDDSGKIIPLSKRDDFNNPDIRYFKDKYGKEITPTPYPGPDSDLANAVLHSLRSVLRDYFSPDKINQIKTTMNWGDLEISELLNEILRTIGSGPDVLIKGPTDGFTDIALHRGLLINSGSEAKGLSTVVLNRERIPDLQTALESGIHEVGVHGKTASLKPENFGKGGRDDRVKEWFPRLAELSLKNKELADEILQPNRMGKFLGLFKNVGDLEKYFVNKGLSWKDKWQKFYDAWKRYKYVTASDETTARAYTGLLFNKVYDPNKKTLNVKLLELYNTPESVEAFKKAVLGIAPILTTAGIMGSLKE